MANLNDPPPPNVTPQPGLVKTVGVFNLVFGGFLLLCGMGCFSPFLQGIVNSASFRLDPKTAQEALDRDRRQRIEDLRQEEQVAATPAEREKLKRRREALEAEHPKVEGTIDFATVNAGLDWMRRYALADVSTGPPLNLLLMVSGVGLILRKNWARHLGLVVAGLKVIRLFALAALLMLVVLPKLAPAFDVLADSPFGKELIEHAMEKQNARRGGPPPGPQPGLKEIAQVLHAFGNVYASLLPFLGSIYPVIVLILLTRPGVRAACLIGDQDEDAAEAGPAAGDVMT